VSRVSDRLGAARDRITATRERIEAARPRSKVLDTVFGAAEHDVVTGGGVLAGAVAFRLFLFLVPYVFVLVAFLGFAAGQSNRPPRDVAADFGAAGLAASAVNNLAGESFWTRFIALVGGLVALFLAARALIKTLQTVHGFIWGTSPPRRANPALTAVGLIVVVTAGLVVARVIAGLRGEVAGVVLVALYIAIPTGVWWLVSVRAMPHPDDATWRDLLPGAITFGVGFEILHVITIVWISRLIENKTDMYGLLGTAAALLFWAYVLGRVMALSAVVNASRWFRNHPPRGAAAGARHAETFEFPDDN
jgi:membrane protein